MPIDSCAIPMLTIIAMLLAVVAMYMLGYARGVIAAYSSSDAVQPVAVLLIVQTRLTTDTR